jgi:hypothetical protein
MPGHCSIGGRVIHFSDFTAEQLATCLRCGAPATHRVIGHPGNVNFGYVCKKHIEPRTRALKNAYTKSDTAGTHEEMKKAHPGGMNAMLNPRSK